MIHAYISFLCQLTWSRSNHVPVTMGILSTQILDSNKYHFPIRKPGLLEEMADLGTEAGNIQDMPRASYSARS